MLITLLGSIIGFLASSVPSILDFFKEKSDKKHELMILEKQIEMQKLLGTQRLDEIEVQGQNAQTEEAYQFANRSTGIRWIEALQSSVRPIITYSFFAIFCYIKIALIAWLFYVYIKDIYHFSFYEYVSMVWDDESKAIFATVISFWFGSRESLKRFLKK